MHPNNKENGTTIDSDNIYLDDTSTAQNMQARQTKAVSDSSIIGAVPFNDSAENNSTVEDIGNDILELKDDASFSQVLQLQKVKDFEMSKTKSGYAVAILNSQKCASHLEKCKYIFQNHILPRINNYIDEFAISIEDEDVKARIAEKLELFRSQRIKGLMATSNDSNNPKRSDVAKKTMALLLSGNEKFNNGIPKPKDALEILALDEICIAEAMASVQSGGKDFTMPSLCQHALVYSNDAFELCMERVGYKLSKEEGAVVSSNVDEGVGAVWMGYNPPSLDPYGLQQMMQDPDSFANKHNKLCGLKQGDKVTIAGIDLNEATFLERLTGIHSARERAFSRSMDEKPELELKQNGVIMSSSSNYTITSNRPPFSPSKDGAFVETNGKTANLIQSLAKENAGGVFSINCSHFQTTGKPNGRTNGHDVAHLFSCNKKGKINKMFLVNSNHTNTREGFFNFSLPMLEELQSEGMLSHEMSSSLRKIKKGATLDGSLQIDPDALDYFIKNYAPEPFPFLKVQGSALDSTCMSHAILNNAICVEMCVKNGGKLPEIDNNGRCVPEVEKEMLSIREGILGNMSPGKSHFASYVARDKNFGGNMLLHFRQKLGTCANIQKEDNGGLSMRVDNERTMASLQVGAHEALADMLSKQTGTKIDPEDVKIELNVFEGKKQGEKTVTFKASVKGLRLEQKHADALSYGIYKAVSGYESHGYGDLKTACFSGIADSIKSGGPPSSFKKKKDPLTLWQSIYAFFTNKKIGNVSALVGKEKEASREITGRSPGLIRKIKKEVVELQEVKSVKKEDVYLSAEESQRRGFLKKILKGDLNNSANYVSVKMEGGLDPNAIKFVDSSGSAIDLSARAAKKYGIDVAKSQKASARFAGVLDSRGQEQNTFNKESAPPRGLALNASSGSGAPPMGMKTIFSADGKLTNSPATTSLNSIKLQPDKMKQQLISGQIVERIIHNNNVTYTSLPSKLAQAMRGDFSLSASSISKPKAKSSMQGYGYTALMFFYIVINHLSQVVAL